MSLSWFGLRTGSMSDVGPGIRLGNRLSGSSLRPPPGRGSVAGRKFLAPPCYSHRAVFASLWALFSSVLCGDYYFRPLFNQRLSSDYFWFGQVGSPITPQRRTFGDWWCEFLHVWCRSCHQSNRIKSLMELCMLPVHGIKIHIYVRIMHWFV